MLAVPVQGRDMNYPLPARARPNAEIFLLVAGAIIKTLQAGNRDESSFYCTQEDVCHPINPSYASSSPLETTGRHSSSVGKQL
jgi:hypothetical protein